MDSAAISDYLKENPSFLIDFLKENPSVFGTDIGASTDTTTAIQPVLDQLTNNPPFNLPDTPYTIAGVSLTPYDIAGILVPSLALLLLLLFMRNCYGYVGMYVWILIILSWYCLKTFLFPMSLPFQPQLNLLSKYIVILFSAIFLVYTIVLLGLQIISLPFKGITSFFGKNSSTPQPIPMAPVAPVAPVLPLSSTTSRQQGGARKKTKPPAAFLYVPPS